MKRLPLHLAAFSLAMASAHTATIVDWGGDYVATGQSLNMGTSSVSGNQSTWDRTGATALSPAANYSGPAFYGIIQNNSSNGPAANISQTQVVNRASGDTITVGWTSSSFTDKTVLGLVYIKQSSFLSYNTGSVTFDSTSSISIAKPTGAGNNYYVKAAVLANGQWYLSNTSSPNAQYSAGLTINNAATEMWGAYTATAASLATLPSSYTTAGSSLTDITAVGYFFFANRTGGATGNSSVAVSDITFSAVPEPSTMVLVAIGGLFLLLRRRRHAAI